MSHTAFRKGILIIFTKQTLLKNTDMKNVFQPICLHFSTDSSADESELLYYLSPVILITKSNSWSDLTISLNQWSVDKLSKFTVMISIKTSSVKNHSLLTMILELFLLSV